MIRIGKSYIKCTRGKVRLCADVTASVKRTLWFEVDGRYEDCLCQRADAFVMVLLPAAMRGGHDIICEDEMSERLHYGLCNYLIPSLAFIGSFYKRIAIHAPLTRGAGHNGKAVGTGFSGGLDCLYTIMTHGPACEYPLTHIAVYNAVAFQRFGKGWRDLFHKACRTAEYFAQEQGLETVFVDTNFYEAIDEKFTNEINTFRHIGCALALSNLFSVYLISSARAANEFELSPDDCATFDLLTVSSCSTESLSFFSAGAEVHRYEKLIKLSDWEPSYRWLHTCYGKGVAGEHNCGYCKKCKEAETVLYAIGKLDRYAGVFDVEEYKNNLPKYIAYIMANKDNYLARQVMKIVYDMNVHIPPSAYVYERQFSRIMDMFKKKEQHI